MKNQKALVIAGFPGIGKSVYADKIKIDSSKIVLDFDPRIFDRENYPQNYIDAINEVKNKVSMIFIGSNKVLLKALKEADIDFVVVYPDKSLKEEYLKKYKERGDSKMFINMMDKEWDEMIDYIEDSGYKIVRLMKKDYYLEDILNIIPKIFPL